MSIWPAFWLSLAVPGAGQLLARSWTAVGWFLLAGLVGAGGAQSLTYADGVLLRGVLIAMQAAMLLAIGIASGLHARALVAPQRRAFPRATEAATTARVRCQPLRGRTVRLSIEVATSHSPVELWRIVSDLPSFLTIDPFHERVSLMRSRPAIGVNLVLDHCVFGVRLRRVGRILAWREGAGFAISDLSLRGKQVGFPHVFYYRIEPSYSHAQMHDGDGSSTPTAVLRVEVRGKWTSPVIPAWLGRLWLAGVCYDHARLLRQAL